MKILKNRIERMDFETVIVTGATGLVGNQLIETLSKEFIVFAVSSRKELVKQRFKYNTNVIPYSNEEMFSGIMPINKASTLIQNAFTRSNEPSQVASATDFVMSVLGLAKRKGIKKVLNISTRSVYKDPEEGELNLEDSPLLPAGTIGIAKHAVECAVREMFSDTNVHFSNLRLASVNEVKTHDVLVRPINLFVESMLEGRPIKVISGTQTMSYIDPRDIASAILALLKVDSAIWKPIYNIGTGWLATAKLLDIAEKVKEIGVNKYGLKTREINIEPRDVIMRAGLDISLIQKDTGWVPKYTLEDMIMAVYDMKINQKRTSADL